MANMTSLIYGIILSMVPIVELRGGIPVAVIGGNPVLLSSIVCTIANMAIIPLFFFFLNFLHMEFMKIKPYENLFNHVIVKVRHKIEPSVNKWGYIGLAIFVGIPLPGTGAYTGTLGAWLLGMNQKKSMLAIALGVIAAGIIVGTIMWLFQSSIVSGAITGFMKFLVPVK
jgi:uncharacterized membrane protein